MIILSNSVFGWIKAGQKSGYESRYYSVDFDRTDHARVAEAYGIKSWSVTDPATLNASLRAAFAFDGPALIDIIRKQCVVVEFLLLPLIYRRIPSYAKQIDAGTDSHARAHD